VNGVYISAFILQYNSATGASRLICPAEFRPESIGGLQDLTIINTLTANSAIVSNLIVDSASTSVTCNIGNDAGYLTIRDGNQLDSWFQRSQTGSTLFLNRNTRYPIQCGSRLYVGDISGISGADTHELAVAGNALVSEGLTTSSVTAETLTVLTPSVGTASVTVAELGSSFSYFRLTHGHHADCYSRGSNAPRVMYLNHYANTGVRCPRLGIGGDPSDVHLDVRGAGRFSGAVTATSFPSSSDERLKDDIVDASLAECTRLLLAIRPKTYVLKNTGKEQLGYVAQDWQREALPAYRNSIVGEALGEEQMLALDYSRVCPILHGALLSALARIEALESRLQ
jgi:hypothetical protein